MKHVNVVEVAELLARLAELENTAPRSASTRRNGSPGTTRRPSCASARSARGEVSGLVLAQRVVRELAGWPSKRTRTANDRDTGSVSAEPATDPPLRADARRNRARVLAAAQEAFATEGLSVPLDEIARRAGVGAGTVYRHFPTKEALFEAIVLHQMQDVIAQVRDRADARTIPAAAFYPDADRVGGTELDETRPGSTRWPRGP